MNKKGFSHWRQFIKVNKPHQGSHDSLPGRSDLERLCLLFGLILHNLWVGEQALKDSSIAELDNVPDYVVHNVHGTQGVKLVSGDI